MTKKRSPSLDDPLLHRARQMVPHLVGTERRVEQQSGARRGEPQHVLPLDEIELVACHEAGLPDQIGRLDRRVAEAQMRYRLRARFVRIVDEVALGIEPRIFGDDLDAVLVGADRAVRAEPVEHRPHTSGGSIGNAGIGRRLVWETSSSMPTVNPFLGSGLRQLVEYRLCQRRVEILRRQAVAAADDARHRAARRRRHRLRQALRRHRDTAARRRARLLGLLQHGDRAHGRRQRRQQRSRGERAEQPHLQHADLLARAPATPRRCRAPSPRRCPSARRPARRPAGRHNRTDGIAARSARRSGPCASARSPAARA